MGSTGPSPQSHVRIHAAPPSALLYVDDAPVSNPYIVEGSGGSAIHRWRAEAPGYVARSSPFALDRDVDLDIVLERDTNAAARARRAVPAKLPSAPPSSSPQASGEGTAPPADLLSSGRKREIDKANPYAP